MTERAIEAIGRKYFHIPFYLKKCGEAGVDLDAVRTEEDFLKIPFTVKDDLRNTSPYERTSTKPEDVFGLFSSNGTTGKKTFYVYNKNDKEMQARFVREFYPKIGIDAGALGGVFGQIGTAVMGHCMMWEWQALNAGFVLCPEPSPGQIIEFVTSVPITDVATLPSVASFPAMTPHWRKAARESHVKHLILGGDFLSKARRSLLEDLWDAEVYNSFGMSECFGPIGCECREQNGFHYLADAFLLEIIDPETLQPVAPGEIGVGVYTTLWDKGFPLLRYWSGDLMSLETAPCACGSPHPRYFHHGRMVDCVRTASGKWVMPCDVEELTLPEGIAHCQVRFCQKKSVQIYYDQSETAPSEELLERLGELFECPKAERVPADMEYMNLRGLKPKYIVEE